MNTPNRRWSSVFKTLQNHISPDNTYQPDDGVNYWREQIFTRVIILMIIGSPLVVGIMAILSFQLKYWAILIVDLVAYVTAFVAAFSKRIKLRTRIHLFMIIIFSLGLALQLIGGPLGNGNIILFVFPIMAAILLGLWDATIALGMNVIAMIVLGILLNAGMLENTRMAQYSMIDWVGNSVGLLFFNALATFSISILLEGLNHSFSRIRETQTALQESQERYQAIIEDQIELIDRWLPDGTLTFVNQAAAEYVGMPREELIGKNFFSFLPEEDQNNLKEGLKTLTPSDPVLTIEEAVTIKGQINWMRWTNRALFNEKGEIQEIQSVGADITERKRAEENLERSENRYRAIVETQHEIISRWNPDGSLTFINDAGCQFYDKSREELLQTSIIDLASLEEKQKLRDYIASFSIENPAQTIQLSGPDKAGNIHWFESHDKAIIEKGRIIEFQSVGRDITEEKNIRDKLLKSEARYRAVVEDQMELIDRLLPDTTIIFCNEAYARFFGKKPEDLIGSKLATLLNPEKAARIQKIISKFTPQNPVASTSHIEVNYRGERRWFRWTDRGIFDEKGNLIEVQGIGEDIHEQKLAEQALLASEARYRSVVEDQLELICRVFSDGTYTFANHAYATFYGSTPDELVGQNVSEVLAANIIKNIDEDHALLTPQNPTRQRTNLTTNAKGETKWFTWTDLGIFDEEGNLIEIQGIGRNIHEQVLVEKALQKSEALYRAIIEDQMELICRTLPDGTLTFVNHAFARFFGKKPEDLIGSNTATIIEPEVTADLVEKIAHLSPENPVLLNTHLATRSSGEKRWIAWTNRCIFDKEKKLVEIQAIGQDIHDRKLAELALLESEARYRAIVENQIEPVCRWRPNYTLTFVNDAYCQLFNKTREELLGQSFKSTVPDEDWMIVEQMVLDLKTGASSAVDENRIYTANGVHWLQWALSAIKGENGTIIEFQSVGHDVSEQKHIQQMLEKTLSDQIKLSKDNSELAERLEGLYLADVNRHETQLRHLAIELHDDVLNALAVVSANIDIEEIPVHVSQAYEQAIQRTREIVSGLRTAMLNYGLYIGLETLADELSDQLPDGPIIYIDIPHSVIRYDPDVELHLFRIAQEACNNAIKHANASEIHIRGELEVEQVLLEITDNGSGFDTEDILDLPDLLRKEAFRDGWHV